MKTRLWLTLLTLLAPWAIAAAALSPAAATTEGEPFLVLEYVEGTELGAYCDERQLTVRARLRLFLQVLGAVHLSVRIRLWPAPLVPPDEAADLLAQAQAVAEQADYLGLLDDLARLKQTHANL